MPKFVVDVDVDVTKRVTVEAEDRHEAEELAEEQVEAELDWDSKSVWVRDTYVVGEIS